MNLPSRPHWWLVNIGNQGIGLVPSGNKLLPEPMLTNFYNTMASLDHEALTPRVKPCTFLPTSKASVALRWSFSCGSNCSITDFINRGRRVIRWNGKDRKDCRGSFLHSLLCWIRCKTFLKSLFDALENRNHIDTWVWKGCRVHTQKYCFTSS